jgi:hypothetical protein
VKLVSNESRDKDLTMKETTDYKLLSTVEGVASKTDEDWKSYPGHRHSDRVWDVMASGPPSGSLLVKTGGNALQAIDPKRLDKHDFMSVVAPEGRNPGDTILVTCPYSAGRLISTTIPEGALPGHVFLVRAPPTQPLLVTGVPVEYSNEKDATQVVNGFDIIAAAAEHELALREEFPRNGRTSTRDVEAGASVNRQGRDRHDSDDGFEMVQNTGDQSRSPAGSGWIAAWFVGKHIIH